MNNNKFQAIVLSGGGSKGILHLGALTYYYEQELYDGSVCAIYAGVSIGAVINLLLVCGYTPMEIFTEFYTNISNLIDVKDFNDIQNVIQNIGLLNIDVFSIKIEDLVKAKLHSEHTPTFRELYNLTNKTLIISIANVTKMKCEYFSHITRPDVNVMDAIKFSCNLPIIFQRILYEECYLVDGGLMDNFPLKQIDDGCIKILGLVITGNVDLMNTEVNESVINPYILSNVNIINDVDIHINKDTNSNATIIGNDTLKLDDEVTPFDQNPNIVKKNNDDATSSVITPLANDLFQKINTHISNFIKYMYRLVVMPMRANTELRYNLAGENVTLLKLNYENNAISLFEFNMTKEKKMDMFVHGYKLAEEYQKDIDSNLYSKIDLNDSIQMDISQHLKIKKTIDISTLNF